MRTLRSLVPLACTVLVCLTVSLLAVFVWPTPYHYIDQRETNTAPFIIHRVMRFTGEVTRAFPRYKPKNWWDDAIPVKP